MRLPLADAPRLQGVHVTTRVEPSAWDAFVLAHPEATGNHLWAWQHVYREAFGHEPRYLAALDAQDAIVGVLPLVMFQRWPLGRFVVSLPFVNYGGVLAEDGRVAQVLLDAAVEEARRIGATHIELRHTTPRFPELAVREHRVSMTRRLSPDCEQEWGNLDRKIRNQVRKAEKHGLTSHVGGCELLDEFYAVFAVNMRDLGTPVYPKAWFAQTIAHFPDRSRVFVVRQDGRAIAGALTFAHPRGVEIPSASSLRTHRALCPNTLLYWHILREAIAGGGESIDFGRSAPGEGTFRFKRQWGAEAGPMAWEYRMLEDRPVPERSPENPTFRLAIAAWRRLPLTVTNHVGPLVASYLP